MHIITGLGIGGAERMLSRLVRALSERFEFHVICLGGETALVADIEADGVEVHVLGMRSGLAFVPGAVVRLTRLLRRLQPQLVQTWLYHADLLGGVAARLAGVNAVVWNVRSSDLPRSSKQLTRLSVRLCAILSSHLPTSIICCANSTRRLHVAMGYDGDRTIVIPNGFALNEFRPDKTARWQVRQELRIPAHASLIGLIARFHPQKNHACFFSAARLLRERGRDAHFLLAGQGVDAGNAELSSLIEEAGVASRTHLLGPRADVARLTAALDVATCCSDWGEAFPNVIGEALACAVPCVTTDVGDAAEIVGAYGRIVPRSDAVALAAAWEALLVMEPLKREQLGAAARARMATEFAMQTVADRYAEVYRRILYGQAA